MGKYRDITQEELKKLFTYRDGNLYWKINIGPYRKGNIAGDLDKILKKQYINNRYVKVSFNGNQYFLHHLIYIWHYGEIEYSRIMKHIDKNKLNNKIENLRLY